MSHAYQYVVLRFVPRVDRGECLNVGVVLHSQSAGVLRCAWHVDDERPIVNKGGGVEAFLEFVAEVVRVGRSDGIGRADHHTPSPRAPGRGREARAVGTAALCKDL